MDCDQSPPNGGGRRQLTSENLQKGYSGAWANRARVGQRRTDTVAVTSSASRVQLAVLSRGWTGPYLPRDVRFQEAAMKDLSEVQEASLFTRKRIAIAIAILIVC